MRRAVARSTPDGGGLEGAGGTAGRRAWLRACRSAPHRAQMRAQLSVHRSLHAAARKATIGFTLARAQCIPLPLSRASTTSLFALSTIPLPMGYPAARNCAY